jgi:hypothetical protein
MSTLSSDAECTASMTTLIRSGVRGSFIYTT